MAPPLSSREKAATSFCSSQAAVVKGERTVNAMASHFNTEAMDSIIFADRLSYVLYTRQPGKATVCQMSRHRGCDQDSLRAEDILDGAQHR